ncbi:hypothetical protein RIF29_29012 [Crotalaria pallida]|uniref:MYB-CC type transcription factor LHEQLE-containing domain-containing protein n=1 Tax=Crotalaria pallida TaxID=3830 RepID=A0AAN9EDU0_CROPI
MIKYRLGQQARKQNEEHHIEKNRCSYVNFSHRSSGPSTSYRGDNERGEIPIAEALRHQIEVQKRLEEQLERRIERLLESCSMKKDEIANMLEKTSQVKQMKDNLSRKEPEFSLLDLYCGCGAMSTGLCLGANLSGFNLVTVSSLLFI